MKIDFIHDYMTDVLTDFPNVNSGMHLVFCFTVDTVCLSLFKIRNLSVQRIYSGFYNYCVITFHGRHVDLKHTFHIYVSHTVNGINSIQLFYFRLKVHI